MSLEGMLGTLRVESNASRGQSGRPARSSKMRLPGIAWWIIGVILVALFILLSAQLALGVAQPDLDPGKTRSFMSADYQPGCGHNLPGIRLEIGGEVRHDRIKEEGDKAASAVLDPMEKAGSFLVTETPGIPPAPTSTPPPSNSPTAAAPTPPPRPPRPARHPPRPPDPLPHPRRAHRRARLPGRHPRQRRIRPRLQRRAQRLLRQHRLPQCVLPPSVAVVAATSTCVAIPPWSLP